LDSVQWADSRDYICELKFKSGLSPREMRVPNKSEKMVKGRVG
jgi:hypothetical protein